MIIIKNFFKIASLIILFILILSALVPMAAATTTSSLLLNSSTNPALDTAALEAARHYSVPFDHDAEIYWIITTDEGRYYVVNYKNYLPLAGGVEILAENGTKVTNSTQATKILKAVAWTESIRSLDDSDITTLGAIRDDTRNIRNTVMPLTNISNTIIDTLNLKRSLNQYGITNEYAIGLITGSVNSTNAGYEGAVILINNLNNQLNDFNNATIDVNERLPAIVARSAEIKKGTGYADEELQDGITSTAADLDVMEGKIATVQGALDNMSDVGDFLATIQQWATGLLAYVPIIGSSLRDYANYLFGVADDYQENVLNLKGYAKNLLDNVRLEKQKLNEITAKATQKTAGLTGSWNARQTAGVKVWFYAIGMAILLIAGLAALVVAVLYRRNLGSFLKSLQGRNNK
ncbi:hypothetical protein [Methanocella sp. MCL-LM]|uniref:hypothetical protein n=1 Tax=Methanocella sp. MCL-LM TaxID=3412035 RepID=UPI003C77ECBC